VEFNGLVSLQLMNGNACRVAGSTRAVRHTETRPVEQSLYHADRRRTFFQEGDALVRCKFKIYSWS